MALSTMRRARPPESCPLHLGRDASALRKDGLARAYRDQTRTLALWDNLDRASRLRQAVRLQPAFRVADALCRALMYACRAASQAAGGGAKRASTD